MHDHFIFGYGSLVNSATHDFNPCHPATLNGWRRVWRKSPVRAAAYLDIEPHASSRIDGLILNTPRADPALDHRERAYNRVQIGDQVGHGLDREIEVNAFSITPAEALPLDRQSVILQSYLDVVTQGYLRVYGESGLTNFFESTTGWTIPVLMDRGDPQYPRHQPAEKLARDLCDAWVGRLTTVVEKLQ